MKEKAQQKQISKHTLKIISFFFAVTLWFYVLSSAPILIEKKLPINFKVPKGMAISNVVEKEVVVKIKGSRVFLRNIFEKNNFIFVNLNRYFFDKKKKNIDVKIGVQDIPVPFGVEVLEIKPSKIEIQLQKIFTKTLPIIPTVVGEVSKEFKLIKENLVPSKLEVSGPKEFVKSLKSISTSPIDVSTLQKSGSLKVATMDIDSRLTITSKDPIYYNYEIRPRKANVSLNNIKVRFLSSARRIRPKKRAVSIDVLMPEGEEKNLEPSQVQVWADIPEGSKGLVKVPLKANLPEGVFLLKIHPQSIEVQVQP